MERPNPAALKEEGLKQFRDGLYPEALDAFSEAQKAFLAAGDKTNAAEMLNNIGVVHRVERRKEQAIAALNEARAIFEELGDQNRVAQTLGNVGSVYAAAREREEAIRHYRQAIEIFGELGDCNRQGETLMALSSVQMKQRQWGEALVTRQSGLSALEKPSLTQRFLLWLLGIALRLLNR